MNKIIFLISTTLLLAKSIYAVDDDCRDNGLFPSDATKCTCIMNNAINDCKSNSPVKSICNQTDLGNFFKKNMSGAQSTCESYGGTPDQCYWSVTFYEQHC